MYRKSPEKYERFFPGDIIRIIDKEDGITEDLPIVKVSNPDITGNGGVEGTDSPTRQEILPVAYPTLARADEEFNEVYAQGATIR